MYIPTTFFGSQGSCFTITTSTISGSGLITTGSFVSGGVYWDYYKFETADYTDPTYQSFTASLNILSGSTGQAKILIVGAGGAGGSGNSGFGIDPQNFAAAGGGGGGVVYYNQFPIISGSYEIGVAGATTQINALATGSNGINSYIKLPNNLTYTPFTSSFLTAYGGGGGGWGEVDGTMPFTCLSTNGGRGSTTGGIGIVSSQCGARNAPDTLYTTLNGITLGPQGFKGGDIETTSVESQPLASGGGGAGSIGQVLTTSMISNGIYASSGGDGLNFTLTGTPFGVSPGGGGEAYGDSGSVGSCINSGSAYGRGGKGERDGNTGEINFGFGGVVIVAIPRCSTAFDCKTFAISGSGNTVNYLECSNFGFTTSSTNIPYYDTLRVCLTTLSGSNTPLLLSGSYLSSTLISNCDTPSSTLIPTTYPIPFDTCSCLSYTITPRVNPITINRIQYCGSSTSGSSLTIASGSATTLCLVSSSVSLLSITGSSYNFDFNGNCATSSCAPLNSLSVNYLIVGGGGAGGGYYGGGGGGGGYLQGVAYLNLSQSYNIVVGNGGTGSAGSVGGNGQDSSAFTFTAIGGGGGGAVRTNQNGLAGGSGGGGGFDLNGTGGAGTSGQGNNGGNGTDTGDDAGGGGGADAVGANGSSNSNGGAGSLWLDGNRYGGGGGGYRTETSLQTGNGIGSNGAGNGAQATSLDVYLRANTSGSANTGGGGGGTGQVATGSMNGGSGIVKIRYVATASLATGGDISITGSFVYHTFTGSGTFTTL